MLESAEILSGTGNNVKMEILISYQSPTLSDLSGFSSEKSTASRIEMKEDY